MTEEQLAQIQRKTAAELLACTKNVPEQTALIVLETHLNSEWWRGYHVAANEQRENDASLRAEAGYLASINAVQEATISRLTEERDALKEMACNWQTAAVAEMERCTAAERERSELIAYEDAERIVRDRLDDITVDDNSRCHWAEVANALTHILGELRAARGVATPTESDALAGGEK